MYLKEPTQNQIKLQHKLQLLARKLRNNPTQAEVVLWNRLKEKQLGCKFRQQYPLFQFIVDFYCSSHRLIIEVDGLIHEQQRDYDQLRDQIMMRHGYSVMRFANAEIMNDLDKVIDKIKEKLNGFTPSLEFTP
ncbi:MAG: DUF559 domain-containing protein [Patescibacteria group bacterium]|jgi:leucyl-tRNA synthetase